MEQINFVGFEPGLKSEHLYAIGLKVEGSFFCPIQSCETQEELSRVYDSWYKFAKSAGNTPPIAVEKDEPNADWRDAKCHTLPELMQEIRNRNQGDRN